MKYSLKRHLLVEKTTHALDLFQDELKSSVTSSDFDGYADIFELKHGECITILEVVIEDRTTQNTAWVNSLVTVDTKGQPALDCFRKGYAKEMMALLTQAADTHGITLELIAAPPAYLKRQMPELPDKDQLAEFYGDYGFYETSSNSAQVFMSRKPQGR